MHSGLSLYLEAIGISIKWGLLLTAPALLLGRRARIPYLVLWPYLALIETVEAVARFAYGMSLDGDWLMIVCASSASEMREFFGQFSWPGIAITAVCLAAVMFAGLAFFHRRQYPATSKFSIGMGALLCTPFVLFNLILSSPICAGNEMMFTFLPLDTIHNYALYSDIARTVHSPRLPPAETASKERIDETLGVIAIGESATRSHWHLYGYERPTTPMMDWRDASSPDIFAVPMIVWLSPEYRARNPEVASAIESIAAKPVCLDELMRVFRILALLDPASLLGKH